MAWHELFEKQMMQLFRNLEDDDKKILNPEIILERFFKPEFSDPIF